MKPAVPVLTYQLGVGALVMALAAGALVPLADRALARRRVRAELRALALAPAPAPERDRDRPSVRAHWVPPAPVGPALSLLVLSGPAPLASWGSIGGCGAGGSSAGSAGGGIIWVGRNVTGGLVDVQTLATATWADGSRFGALSTRVGGHVSERFGLALTVPVLDKAGDVAVLGVTKQARIAGFGDVSIEGSFELGPIRSHRLAFIASAPTGSADAVRQGVVLPAHLQLGSGVPGLTCQYQHTRDFDWGLALVGGTASYGGWENSIGDFRAPSATAYAHVGYVLGPFVPAAGLTVFGKPMHDRERGAPRLAARDPLLTLAPSVSLEWAGDWVALMPAATAGISPRGLESVSIGVGVSSALF